MRDRKLYATILGVQAPWTVDTIELDLAGGTVHFVQLARDEGAGVAHRLQRAVATAVASYPTLKRRPISPHTLRHMTAMHLLQAGLDITVVALWLGHESPVTTQLYVEADLALKRRALDSLTEPTSRRLRHPVGD